ncbi:MAG: GNAT family N-acetyltransferase [Lachnospiraceae bacterium]|nr:GNAT family N-acetyltransferase [Lachnospiraceae bacterium]
MVRFAKIEDLERVNELRKIVNDVHVEGRPDIFKAGFHDELRDFIYDIWDTENKDIIVAERNGVICGFACVQYVSKPESPFMNARTFYDVDEFGVDTAFRRQGVATELIAFIKEDAKKRGIDRIELNMWEFNQGALAFYESVGFQTYRRYMELGSD